MSLDPTYNVAIKLAATNAVSGVLAVISKDVLGLHGSVKDLEKGFGAWAPAITGAAAAIAGIKLGEMIAGVVEAGAKLEHFKTQLLAATGDVAKVADATNVAWLETSRNLNTSVSDNVKNIQHLMAVTGSFAEAKQMLHPFSLADTALLSLKDKELSGSLRGGEGVENNTLNFARALEQLGVTQDEHKLNSYLEGMTRTMISMRGQVDGTKYFNAINNAGASRYGWDEDFVEKGLGPLIQSTGGKIGVQLYQLDRTFGQGVASSITQAKGAEKYGFWSEDDELWEGGKFKGMKPNSGFEPDVRKANPVKWAGDVREMLKARGVNIDDTDAMTGVVAEVGRGNKNLGAVLSELILPKPYQALVKERGNIEAVPQDAVGILQGKDPNLAMKAFSTQWENLMQALGSPMVETATGVLSAFAKAFNSIATEAAAHPDAVKAIGVGLTGLAAGLVAVGTVLVGGAVVGAAGAVGVTGGVVASVAALTTALTAGATAFVAYKDQISAFFESIRSALSGLFGSGTDVGSVNKDFQNDRKNLNPLFKKSAFSNDNDSPLTIAVRDGFLQAFGMVQGGGAGLGGGGGGSGIVNASFESGGPSIGGSFAGRGAMPGANGMIGSKHPEMQSYIRQKAAALGIDPNVALRVAASEGLNGYVGDYGTSFGPYQLHYGGSGIRGMNSGGLGDVFTKQTGLNARDPSTWQKQIDFALGYAAKHGWGDWHGAARVGIGRMQGIGAPPAKKTPIVIHHNTHLDGEIVAQNTSKHFARGMEFPSAVGGPDTYGSWQGPATPLSDAA